MPFDDPFGVSSIQFLNQPIDVILFKLILWFGWIPILFVLVWGFIQVYQSFQQGKYVASLRFVILAIDIPSATEQSPKALEHLFANLLGAKSSLTWKEIWIIGKLHPVFSFEIASTEGYIQFYVHTQTRFRDTIEAGIYAHYPDAEINEVEDYTPNVPDTFPNDDYEMWGTELILKEDYIFPIRTYVDFEDRLTQEIKDPIAQTLESMSRMKPGEHFWIQFLVQPTGNDWKDKGNQYIAKIFGQDKAASPGLIASGLKGALSIPSGVIAEATGVDMSSILFGGGDDQEEDIWKAFKITLAEKEKIEGVLRKIGKPGLATKVRILYWGRKEVYDKQARTAMVKGVLLQYAHLNLNSFGLYASQTPKDDYFWQRWVYTQKQERLVRGYKTRSWGIGATPYYLNSEELASLWHFPAVGIKTPLLRKVESRRAEPPVGLPMTFNEEELPSIPPGVLGAPIDETAPYIPGPEPTARKGEPPTSLPTFEDVAPDIAMTAPTASARVQDQTSRSSTAQPEEREMGMDATDMGPPADVVLPGPSSGFVPEPQAPTRDKSFEESEKDVPPNLPV